MRYYSIIISSADGTIVRPASLANANLPATYTSYANGQNIPGALNVDLDLPIAGLADPLSAGGHVRVWGVSLAEIGQANDLINKNVAILGGMQKGLPLANPRQSGLLVKGQILQAYGNWVGTDMSLEFVIFPPFGSPSAPKNVTINWKAGTKLADAIKQTLATAIPGYTQDINISPNLVLARDQPGYYESIAQFSDFVQKISKSIIKTAGYPGVSIYAQGGKLIAADGTKSTPVINIEFQDLVGQPTWIRSPLIQVKTVMRADIGVDSQIVLPQGVIATTSPAVAQTPAVLRDRSVFQGSFKVQSVRHVGNFRQPDAASWCTVLEAYPLTKPQAPSA